VAGTYKEFNGSAPCTECSQGKYSTKTGEISDTTCDDCPSHAYSGSGCIICTCMKGYTGPDGVACTACIAGTYKHVNGSSPCTLCSPGKYSTETGEVLESSCDACPAHTHSSGGSASIMSCTCNQGYTGPNGESCTACSVGTYKDVDGPAVCTFCSRGKYSTAVAAMSEATCLGCPSYTYSGLGSGNVTNCTCTKGFTGPDGVECTACVAGTFKDMNGSAPCSLCERGKYSTVTAAMAESTCVGCPSYSESGPGSYNKTHCRCHPGFSSKAAGQKCTACAPNTFKAVNGSSACITCDEGKFSSTSTTAVACTICQQGYTGRGCLIRQPSKSENRAFLVQLSLTVEPIVSEEPLFQDDLRGNLSEFFTVSEEQVNISNVLYRRSLKHIGIAAAVVVVDSREDFVSNASAIQLNLREFLLYVHSSLDVTSLHAHCGRGFGYNPLLAGEPCVPCDPNFYQDEIRNSTCTQCPALMISPQASRSSENCTCQVFVYYS